jgi:hypothetical protein
MVDFPPHRPVEAAERAAFYRTMAADALRRAQTAVAPETRRTFLQIAESYITLASAVEDIARKGLWP